MTIDVKIIADSISEENIRLTTFQLRYPRIVHCFHEDTEFLSQIGDEFPRWRGFDSIVSLKAKIAQFEDGEISFTPPQAAVKRPSDGSLIVHQRGTFEMAVTPGHRMFSLRRTTGNEFVPNTDTAADWLGDYSAHRRIPQAAQLIASAREHQVCPIEAELIAFYVADGHRPKVGTQCSFHFRKSRKIERVSQLLTGIGISHEVRKYNKETVIWFDPPAWVSDCYTETGEKKYPEFLWKLSSEAYEAFRQGTLLSDGNLENREINSTSREVADQTQILAAFNGEAMNIRSYSGGLYKQKYQDTNYVSFRADKNQFEERDYRGDVVCFTVPSSYLFVRYKGFAFVSGNCELMTHRVFSRNASSSRAIPIPRTIKDILTDPAEPVSWGSNKPGMQAGAELSGVRRALVRAAWHGTKRCAILGARVSQWAGAHKQVANRILEPWSHISVVLTSTDFANWFALRCHENADPTIHQLAAEMGWTYRDSTPALLQPGEWHLPYVDEEVDLKTAKKMSAARCARVSYLNHDGTRPSLDADLKLFDYLVKDAPVHASPTEHQATPDKLWTRNRWGRPELHGNLRGWCQHRKMIPGEVVRENV